MHTFNVRREQDSAIHSELNLITSTEHKKHAVNLNETFIRRYLRPTLTLSPVNSTRGLALINNLIYVALISLQQCAHW